MRTWLSSGFGALLLSALGAAQSTYVVDDNGGPGVHFTDLPAAIAVALPGDVLDVRAGDYSGFTLSKGLTIVGEFGVLVFGATTVAAVPAGEHVIVASLDLETTSFTGCAGTVTFDGCSFTGATPVAGLVTVQGCTDVRFHRSSFLASVTHTSGGFSSVGGDALVVDAARVELSSCTLRGGDGADFGIGTAKRGGQGLKCFSGTRVHIALTRITGGTGGKGNSFVLQPGASGGDALRVHGGATAIVAGGPWIELLGGAMGVPYGIGNHAPGWGANIDSGGLLRHSGTRITRGGPWNGAGIFSVGGAVQQAVPDDPTLELVGSVEPGGMVQLRLHGVPGASARLQQGNTPLVVDDGNAGIEKLANRIRLHPLGPIPGTGLSSYDLAVPSAWAPGQYRVFQGLEIDGGTGLLIERTNSLPTLVR